MVLGGYVAFNLFDSFYLQPEALFSMKGTKQNDPESGIRGRLEERWTLTYLEIPVVAGFRFRSIHLIAGPSFGFYLDGKYVSEFKGGPNDGQKNEESFDDGRIEGTDMGLIFGAGYTLKGVSLEARYAVGLANILPANEDNVKLKNRVLQFMLGVSL
jgi:hypothetical protein